MVSLSVFSLRVLRFFFLSRFLYFVPSSSLLLMFVLFGFACGFNFSGIPRWVPWVFSKEPSGEVGNPRSQNPLSIGLRRRLACIPISGTSLSISPRFSLFSHFFFFFFIYGFLLLIWVLFFANSSVVTNLHMGYLSNTIDTCYNYELQPKFCAN